MDSTTLSKYNELLVVLGDVNSGHLKLAEHLNLKRAALRVANYARVTRLCETENQIVQSISELEKRRLHITAELTLLLEPQASEPMRLADLAQKLDEPRRRRLLEMREQLLRTMLDVRRQSSVARRSTEALVAHMQGLMQTIGSACGGIYGRNGSPPQQSITLSTINTTA